MNLKRAVARALLAVSPWSVVTQEMPERVVLVGAPHTSYLDGVLMAVSLWSAERELRFLVRDSVAQAPLIGTVIRAVGGIPVERSTSHGLVDQMVARFADDVSFVLCLAPKGTRGERDFWRSGFYRIATQADVPVQLGFVDRRARTFGWGPASRLTGDVRADTDVIRAFYEGEGGVRPSPACVPRLCAGRRRAPRLKEATERLTAPPRRGAYDPGVTPDHRDSAPRPDARTPMRQSRTRSLTALSLSAVAALVLGACSGSSDSPAAPSAPTTAATTAIAVGGSFEGTADGKALEVPDAGVACRVQDSSTTMAVASQSGTAQASASVVLDGQGKVILVDLVSAATGPVSYSDGFNVGSAIAEHDGSTWTVRGEGTTSTDASPAPDSSTVPFELSITCP